MILTKKKLNNGVALGTLELFTLSTLTITWENAIIFFRALVLL